LKREWSEWGAVWCGTEWRHIFSQVKLDETINSSHVMGEEGFHSQVFHFCAAKVVWIIMEEYVKRPLS